MVSRITHWLICPSRSSSGLRFVSASAVPPLALCWSQRWASILFSKAATLPGKNRTRKPHAHRQLHQPWRAAALRGLKQLLNELNRLNGISSKRKGGRMTHQELDVYADFSRRATVACANDSAITVQRRLQNTENFARESLAQLDATRLLKQNATS